MEHITTTPFGARPVTAGHLALLRELDGASARRAAAAPAQGREPDKWVLLRDLGVSRAAFGVSDRDLAVLDTLLGFHPARTLDPAAPEGLVVFPSNAALGERTHGMAESTLRRHLAALVAAGLIRRQDSPNGKRYAARDASGALVRAFGFDLAPLALRTGEIQAAACAAREAALRLKRLRETAMLRLRDVEKLAAYGATAVPAAADWHGLVARATAARRGLRARLDAGDLERAGDELTALLVEVAGSIEPDPSPQSEKMSGKADESERLHLNSKTDKSESEGCLEAAGRPVPAVFGRSLLGGMPETDRVAWTVPFGFVRGACVDIGCYAPNGLKDWPDLVAAAELVRPMMGVSAAAWAEARAAMGDRAAATTLACILQATDRITRPGGYLRALTAKARGAGFSPTPMVAALARRSS